MQVLLPGGVRDNLWACDPIKLDASMQCWPHWGWTIKNPWMWTSEITYKALGHCAVFRGEVFSIWEHSDGSNISWKFFGCKWQELNLTIGTHIFISTTPNGGMGGSWDAPGTAGGRKAPLRVVSTAFYGSAAFSHSSAAHSNADSS